MASNVNQTYPPAPGAQTPLVELAPSGNTSASTQVTNWNYASGSPAVTTPTVAYVDISDQYIKGQQEYPR